MYDYIIVGAGSAGCVLAGRLSEDPAARVLLLEAGPPDRKLEVRIPAAFSKLFKTAVDWNYSTEPEAQLLGPGPLIDHGLVPRREHGLTIGAILLRPTSRGRITLRSADSLEPPRIEPRYLSDPAGKDLSVLMTGVGLARRIFSMPALAPLAGEPMEPGAEVREDAAVEAFIREQAESLYHPVGTCRMGVDDFAVVDSELRVRGIEGLRVVDASIMPTIIRGHTNAPTIMIAERAASVIAGDSHAMPRIACSKRAI